MINHIIQALILILGGLAIALIASTSQKKQIIGFLCGALSEPLWIYTALSARQWGVICLAIWWTYWYITGFYRRIK